MENHCSGWLYRAFAAMTNITAATTNAPIDTAILVGIISTPVHTSSVKNDTLLTHTATLFIKSNII